MSSSVSIPFTKTSIALQDLSSTHLSSAPSEHLFQRHQSVLDTIQQATLCWHTSFKGTQTSHSCPTFHQLPRLGVPTKLYVLHRLVTGTDSASKCAHRALVERAPSSRTQQEELQERLGQVVKASVQCDLTMQWFHVNAHEQMLALGDREMMNIVGEIDDPYVQNALKLWRHFPDLFDYFVPLNVQYTYEKQLHCSCVHRWAWDERTYELEVFTPRQSLPNAKLHHICYRITMMSLLDTNRCKHVRLKWFPSKCTKELGRHRPHRHQHHCCSQTPVPSTTTIWNPYQINTGATYRNTCNSVTIWRSEEAGKTFLHEMMHGYGWDFDTPEHLVHDWVFRHFAVHSKTEIRFYEAYVETWATLLNVYMTVLYYHGTRNTRNTRNTHKRKIPSTTRKHKNKNKNNSRRHTRTSTTTISQQATHAIRALVHAEQQFVLFQVAKVLVHSGFERWQDFFTDSASATQSSSHPLFQQTTSVFSYFIIRSAHLWDVGWFVQRFRSPNFHRHQTPALFDEWLAHLLTVYRTPKYASTIDTRMKWIRAHLTKQKKKSLVLDTMRMTCVESV